MSEKPKKKKIAWQKHLAIAFVVLLSAASGILMELHIDKLADAEELLHEELLSLIGLFGMCAALFVQTVIHEAGHLVFGLLSGYKFSSFRIFSFMWIRENGKVRLRRLSVAGTGGQCLMAPPDMVDGRIPIVLYNFGGSLMNMIAGIVFLGAFLMFANIPFLSTVMLLLAVIGFIFAILNGVPMRMGTVDNDGYNAVAVAQNTEAMRSMWVQMKVNEQISKGVRLRDMPDEWFTVPSDEAMKNSMVVVMGVLACNRLMDAKQFAEADKLMAHMLEIDSGMVGLHRSLMICDRIYVELITENRRDILAGMLHKEQKKFMKQMKNFPSVLRTQYVYALLSEKDAAKADKIKAQFEKCAKSYPYQNDVQSERELMENAEKMSIAT